MKKVLIISFLLAGCALTPEERAVNMVKKYGPTCEALGYPKETDKYRDCVTSMYNAAVMADAQYSSGVYQGTRGKRRSY